MNKVNPRKSIALITAIAVFLTMFAAFSWAGAEYTYAASEVSINKKGTVTDGPLNVRSGAGTNYSKIGKLSKGKTITVLTRKTNSKGEKWYKFKYSSSKYGYVSAKYVKLTSSAADKVTAFTRKAKIKSDTLTVRSGAGTSYSKLGTLKKGDVIYTTKKVKKSSGAVWYQITYKGKTAYVSGNSKYVTLTSIVSEEKINSKAVVKEGPLNVRSGAGTSYSKIGTLKEGKSFNAVLKVKKTDGTVWYKFKYSSSKYGYVSSKYVELSNVKSESAFKRKAVVKSSTLTMRSGPGAEYKNIGSLKKGTEIFIEKKYVLTSGAVWYQYKYNGKTSYSSGKSDYITLTDIVSESSVNKKATVKEGPLNVRSGPGGSYAKLGTLEAGKVITVLAKVTNTAKEEWYKYTFSSGKYGYVSAQHIQMGTVESFKIGTVTTDSGISLNVRSGAGTGYSRLGSLASGSVVTVTGTKKDSKGKPWYSYEFSSSKDGWICSDYVTVKTVTSTADFENYMDEQGFPDSYKPALRALKATHPEWVFKAYDVGCTWSSAISKENAKPGINVVSSSSPKSYRSKDKDCYNSKTGVWSRYDGGWYSAHTDVIRYYMDPRNFLNETGIYQFLTHKYDSATQNTSTVKAVIKGTFMETRKPAKTDGGSSFAAVINKAGKNSGVSPNVLAAMIIQEQGVKGTSGSISGKVKKYEGYYNFLNIGAWTTSTMTAVERGLWYAKEEGWNSEYKSILGGAKTYYNNYVERNQYTFYTKKFNVMNGSSQIGVHQYMTNVQGAYGEGLQLKKAFPEKYDGALTFIIPVYDSMPEDPCDLP